MIYEAQSRETMSDSLKIDCVIAGMGHSSMREHLLLSATKCDSWSNSNFGREVESIEHATKTISAPTPMEINSFQFNCHECGKYGHTVKECRSSSQAGAEKLQCAQCGKRHRGRKGDGNGTQKGGKSKGGKGGTQGKGKGKKGQRLNQNHRTSRRAVDKRILGTVVRSILAN